MKQKIKNLWKKIERWMVPLLLLLACCVAVILYAWISPWNMLGMRFAQNITMSQSLSIAATALILAILFMNDVERKYISIISLLIIGFVLPGIYLFLSITSIFLLVIAALLLVYLLHHEDLKEMIGL